MSTQYNGKATNVTVPVSVPILSSTNTAPIAVTTNGVHNLQTGDSVVIFGHQVNTAANMLTTVTVTGASTFTLDHSTGNGVGGATGTVQSLGLGSTYAQPSDGDAQNAASVDVALDALGDRTAAFGVATGPVRPFLLINSPEDDVGGSESTVRGSVTFTSAFTWFSVFAPYTVSDILQGGDIIDVEFSGSASWALGSSVILLTSLWIAFGPSGGAMGSASKIPGSGTRLASQAATAWDGVHMRGQVAVPNGSQSATLYVYSYCGAGAGGPTMSIVGDYSVTGMVWRPTVFTSRTG